MGNMGKSRVTQTNLAEETLQLNSLWFIRLYFAANNWLQRQAKLTALSYNEIIIVEHVGLLVWGILDGKPPLISNSVT